MNEIFDKQSKLLQLLATKRPEYLQPSVLPRCTKGNLVAYIKDMQYFLNVEVQELIMAIGNEDSAVFKPWKATYAIKQAESYEPKLVVQNEAVDVLCFAINICLAVGIKPNEINAIYKEINSNNINRQQEGY